MTRFTRSDAVEYLNRSGLSVTYPALSSLAQRKQGPRYTREGRDCEYSEEDLKRYVDEEKAKRGEQK